MQKEKPVAPVGTETVRVIACFYYDAFYDLNRDERKRNLKVGLREKNWRNIWAKCR